MPTILRPNQLPWALKGNGLPTDGTDRHGNKEDNLLLAALARSKLSKLKTMSIVGREDNADNIAPKSISLGRSREMDCPRMTRIGTETKKTTSYSLRS